MSSIDKFKMFLEIQIVFKHLNLYFLQMDTAAKMNFLLIYCKMNVSVRMPGATKTVTTRTSRELKKS